MSDLGPGKVILPDAMKALVPGWDPESGVPPASNTLYATISNPENATKFTSKHIAVFNTILTDPKYANHLEDLRGMDLAALDKLGFIFNPEDFRNKIDDYYADLNVFETWSKGGKDVDDNKLLESLFGAAGVSQLNQINSLLEEFKATGQRLPNALKALDKDGNFQVDYLEEGKLKDTFAPLIFKDGGMKSLTEILNAQGTIAGLTATIKDVSANGRGMVTQAQFETDLQSIGLSTSNISFISRTGSLDFPGADELVEYLADNEGSIALLPAALQAQAKDLIKKRPVILAMANTKKIPETFPRKKFGDSAQSIQDAYTPHITAFKELQASLKTPGLTDKQKAVIKDRIATSRKRLAETGNAIGVIFSEHGMRDWQTSDNAKHARAVLAQFESALGMKWTYSEGDGWAGAGLE